MSAATRSGFVAVVGRPNVGKSTLVNKLVGQKVSITTPRPQTTRHRILGIVQRENAEIILVDTPGVHPAGKRALNRVLNRTALHSLAEADVILWLLEAGRFHEDDEHVLKALARQDKPVFALLNKIDRVKPKERVLGYLSEISAKGKFAEIIPVSALKASNLDRLLDVLVTYLPESEFHYGEDQVTDRSERFLVAETVREKLTLRLNNELPYGLTVGIENYDTVSRPIRISANILVDKESHKPIVIGKKGALLKEVGTSARHDIERMLGEQVHLELWVRVRENWADSEAELSKLGFE